jgi:phage gp36-like protein
VSYVTPAQLVDGPGRLTELTELFQVADDALLRATIDSTTRAAWDAGQIAVADAALATILAEIGRADAEIEARLAMRAYTLPVSTTTFPILVSWARAIVRYCLHPQRERDSAELLSRIERDYLDAIKALNFVAKGELLLGASDPLAIIAPLPAAGGPTAVAPTRVWDSCSLRDY